MRPDNAAGPLQGPLHFDIVANLRDRKFRDKHKLFAIEGVRQLSCACDYVWPIVALFVCDRLLKIELARMQIRRLKQRGVRVISVQPKECVDNSYLPDSQGVFAVVRQRWDSLPERPSPHELWLGLETIRNPGNLGTILRVGEATGATGVFCLNARVDPYEPSVLRAAMGSAFAHRYMRPSYERLAEWRERHDLTVFGATGDAPSDYRQASYRRSSMLMLGDERAGLSESQRTACDRLVRIPMAGRTDSLNVAMAATVLLYEAYGQRHPVAKRR